MRPNNRIHPVLHSPSSEATATVPSLSHSDSDRLIKPFRVGTHRQQNPILSSTLATNGAFSSHECMGSSPTSYNDNHMNHSSHSHPNDTASCEPCPPPHTVHLPSIICNHIPPSFHCSISGRCLHWMNNEYMLVTLHKMTSTNNHVHIPDVSNGCGSQSRDVIFGGSKQYMLTSNLEGTTSEQRLGHHSHIEFIPGLLLRTEQIRGKGLSIGTEVVYQ